MQLAFKEDFEEARRRIEAWWECGVIDRVCIQVTAPKEGGPPIPDPPADIVRAWTDVDYAISKAEARIVSTFYGGEALPVYFPNLGPDIFSAYLGCPLHFAEDTSWSSPIIEDWDSAPPLKFDKNNRWWRLTEELTARAVERGTGRFLVGLTDLHGGGDALEALRGAENLCVDLVYEPDRVKEAMKFVEGMWFEVYEGIHRIIRERFEGTTTWLGVWSPGRYYPVSCDFSCMISPQMFEEFFLPELVAEINWLDHSLYHLDGPGAIQHLDLLLEIPKLNGIQWVPGAGRDEMLQWVPLLKRIQGAGKCIHISARPWEIEPLLEELSPEGLMLSTSVGSVDEAKELLKNAERWTRGRGRLGASRPPVDGF